MEDQRLGNEVL